MKYAHYVKMRVFVKESEDEEKIIEKIKEIFPFDFEKQKIELKRDFVGKRQKEEDEEKEEEEEVDEQEEEVINVEESVVEQFDVEEEGEEREIEEDKTNIVYSVEITAQRHTTKFLEEFMKRFDEKEINLLSTQLESRLDDNLDFYIRLDKDKLLDENKAYVVDQGNCFWFKISIAAYPHSREIAKKIVEKILELSK